MSYGLRPQRVWACLVLMLSFIRVFEFLALVALARDEEQRGVPADRLDSLLKLVRF